MYTINFISNEQLWKETDYYLPEQLIIQIEHDIIKFYTDDSKFLIKYDPAISSNTIHIEYGYYGGNFIMDYHKSTHKSELLLLKIGNEFIKLNTDNHNINFDNIAEQNPNFLCLHKTKYNVSFPIMTTDKYLSAEQLQYIYNNCSFASCIRMMQKQYYYINYFIQCDFVQTFEAIERGDFYEIIDKTNTHISYSDVYCKNLKQFNDTLIEFKNNQNITIIKEDKEKKIIKYKQKYNMHNNWFKLHYNCSIAYILAIHKIPLEKINELLHMNLDAEKYFSELFEKPPYMNGTNKNNLGEQVYVRFGNEYNNIVEIFSDQKLQFIK